MLAQSQNQSCMLNDSDKELVCGILEPLLQSNNEEQSLADTSVNLTTCASLMSNLLGQTRASTLASQKSNKTADGDEEEEEDDLHLEEVQAALQASVL